MISEFVTKAETRMLYVRKQKAMAMQESDLNESKHLIVTLLIIRYNI